MTLQNWVSQLWPYSTGFFSCDLSAWRYRAPLCSAWLNFPQKYLMPCLTADPSVVVKSRAAYFRVAVAAEE